MQPFPTKTPLAQVRIAEQALVLIRAGKDENLQECRPKVDVLVKSLGSNSHQQKVLSAQYLTCSCCDHVGQLQNRKTQESRK